MRKQNVFLYCTGIDDIVCGLPKVAGIQVQMWFWAKTFASHGWKVYSFSEKGIRLSDDSVRFVKLRQPRILHTLHLQLVTELLGCLKLGFIHPNLVVLRGARRENFFVAILCKLLSIKTVFFGASDVGFIPGKEQIAGSRKNTIIFRKSIRYIDYFVTQNEIQHDSLFFNYCRKSIVVPNIWLPTSRSKSREKGYDVLWIANLRPLKRAEWLLGLANSLPARSFAMVGGPNDPKYYDYIEQEANKIPNIDFIGAKPFNYVDNLLSNSKLLVCTSEFEGFPNTFLQAWANSIPVVSTVNPNKILTEKGIGIYVETLEDLIQKVDNLLSDKQLYNLMKTNIKAYFEANHSNEVAYNKIIKLLDSELL